MEIPNAPRPEEAAQYAQRMREIKEISSGRRPRARQRKASSSHRRETTQGDGNEGQGAPRHSEPSALSSDHIEEPGVFGGGLDGGLPANRDRKVSAVHSADRQGGHYDERVQRRSRQEPGRRGVEDVSRSDERVRAPRRRARTSQNARVTSQKMPSLAVIIVSAATSAVVSVGTVVAATAPGGALASLVANGWWM